MSQGSNELNAHYLSATHAREMGRYDPRDEDLHEPPRGNTSAELTETQLFGFSVPEAQIHALLYTWVHPNLGVMSSGAFVAQGLRRHHGAADICDFRTYLDASELNGSLTSYRTSGGYSVEMLEPGKLFRTRYEDPERGNSFDVYHEALQPPCMWSNGTHFDQVMRTSGEVILRGRRYDVDGTHIRDRSWGESRSEAPRTVPPVTWMSGVIGELSFLLVAHDDPDLDPIWKDNFPIAREELLKFGWVNLSGEVSPLVSVRKITRYDADYFPTRIEMVIKAQNGREFVIEGDMQGGFLLDAWHCTRWPICLTRWTWDDRVGWGEVQDGHFTDFLLTVD